MKQKGNTINHMAVWLCVIIFQVLSAFWYSPLLFADSWMNYLGKTISDFKGESPTGLIFSLCGAIGLCYFLAWLFKQLRVHTGLKGAGIAFFLALFFFAFQTFTQDQFSLRPHGLSLINTSVVVVTVSLNGFILGAWTKVSPPVTQEA